MTPRIRHPEAGLTLIETAIAIAILGLIVSAGISIYDRAQEQRRQRVTEERMDIITDALSVYAETAGRIPCPADPGLNDITFGWEVNVTATDLQVGAGRFPMGSCGTAGSVSGGPAGRTEGMVPFFTLGLPPEMARDGWGNYFTYAVSPVFARHNIETSTIDAGDVHGRCRHQGWTGIEPGIDDRTRNAVKARFCCMDQRDPTYAPNTDLIIRHADGTLLSPTRGADGNLIFPSPTPPPPTSPPGADRIYANVHIRTSSLVPPDDISVPEAFNSGVLAPAFVLVSHGEDGFGAYLANGSTNRVTTGTGSPTQQENSGGDFRIFVDGPPDRAGNNYFDDIVRWMTQDGLIAAHGALSCQYP